jgi:UDP-3-O-[3-hydroxymyristoyl] N-acetylglucosamine deacetylase
VQTTLNSRVTLQGRGLHLGRAVSVVLCPAPAGHGIVFRRTDLDPVADLPARWDHVEQTALNTRLRTDAAEVSTIEHLMAALSGTGVHNCLIEIDAPEVPILDGSARPFVEAILAAGLRRLSAPLYAIEVLRPVEVTQGEALARLSPAPALRIDFTIDFPDPAIGHQHHELNLANGAFVHELSDSRTFCRSAEVEAMRARGLALGGTLDNAVVVDGDRVLTPGGLRHEDEPVRHKMLDAVGDLATAGAPILGLYTGIRAGHALTNRLLRELFADPSNWRLRKVTPALAARLPGAGVVPIHLDAVA